MKTTLKGIGILGLAAVLAVSFALGTACQKAGEKSAEKMAEDAIAKYTGGKAKVDLSEGTIKVQGQDGKTQYSMGAQEWPKDLPAGVAKPASAGVQGVTSSDSPNGHIWVIQLTGVSAESVKQYTDDLKAAGWEMVSEVNSGDVSIFNAKKDNIELTGTHNVVEKFMSFSVQVRKSE